MSYYESKKLVEERAKCVSELQSIAKKAKEENREMSAEEQSQFDRLYEAQKEFQTKIESAKRVEAAEGLGEARFEIQLSDKVQTRAPRHMITEEERDMALRGWLLANSEQPDKNRPEFEQAAAKCGIDFRSGLYQFEFPHKNKSWWQEKRTGQSEGTWPQNGSTGAAGGFLVQQSELIREVDVALKYYANMRKWCKVLRTPTGEVNWHPTVDDTSNVAELHTELAAVNDTDFVFGHQKVPVFVYDTGSYPISYELLQDVRVPLVEIISELLGVRIGRKQNTDFTVGDSSGAQPYGIKPDVIANGNVFTTASAGTCTYADIVGTVYALDRAYRELPSVGFMASDSWIKNAWALVDSNNRPLMNMDTDLIEPRDRVLGFPVLPNNDLDTVAAGNYACLFGAFEKATVRDALELNIRILNEVYVPTNLGIGIVAWMRSGFKTINPKAFVAQHIHT